MSSSPTFHRLVLSFDQRDTTADMDAFARHLGPMKTRTGRLRLHLRLTFNGSPDATGFWCMTGTSRASNSIIRR